MGKNFQMKLGAPNIKGRTQTDDINKAKSPDETEIVKKSEIIESNHEQENEIRDEARSVESKGDQSLKVKTDNSVNKTVNISTEDKNKNSNGNDNPFLQTKENYDAAAVIKTGYKMRVEYKQTLKLLAEIKKGYTIEALLDDALTMYLKNTPEAQSAITMLRAMTK